jgi:hypothetical protein
MVDLHGPVPRDPDRGAQGEPGPQTTSAVRLDQDPLGTDAYGLLEELAWALELRDAADQDSPAWVADREIRRLEHGVTEFVHASLGRRGACVPALEFPGGAATRTGQRGGDDRSEIQ